MLQVFTKENPIYEKLKYSSSKGVKRNKNKEKQ